MVINSFRSRNFEQIVHKKTATALCLTSVKNEDKLEFGKIVEAVKANYNDKYDEHRKKWGGGIMGSKFQAKTKSKERLVAKEAAQRMTWALMLIAVMDHWRMHYGNNTLGSIMVFSALWLSILVT